MTRLPLIRPLAVRVCGAWGGALGRRMSCAYTAKTDKLRRLAPRCRLPAHSHSALASRQSPWLLHGRLAETTLAASWNASIAPYSRLSAWGGGVSGQKPGGWRGLKVPQRDQSYGSEAEPLQEVMEAALVVCETWLL